MEVSYKIKHTGSLNDVNIFRKRSRQSLNTESKTTKSVPLKYYYLVNPFGFTFLYNSLFLRLESVRGAFYILETPGPPEIPVPKRNIQTKQEDRFSSLVETDVE